jgi:hypothetical protein
MHISFRARLASVHAIVALSALLAVACSSSSAPATGGSDSGMDATGPGVDGGEDATADTGSPGMDSSTEVDTGTSAVESGTPPADGGPAPVDGGSTSPEADTDSGTPPSDGGTPGNDSGSPGGDAGSCPDIQGTWKATAVSCNGTPLNISSITWILTVNGPDASFSESILGGCALISSGGIACTGSSFTVVWSSPNQCNPANCSMWGAQCTETPNEWLGWDISNQTATTFLATSEKEPDGGPTPLTTCRSQGQSDPIQITWTKQ